jgi:hypothetical protein
MTSLPQYLRLLVEPLRVVRTARWVACACVVVLFAQGIAARPTGYLHSWNQISALTVIRQLSYEPQSLLAPTGVIARVTTPVVAGSTPEERFFNFQEFPLYHGIAALVATLLGWMGVSLEVAGRLVSILFWALQWCALRRLMRERQYLERSLVDLVYLCSFALVYYGQAIMSDVAMAAMGAWAVERAVSWRAIGGTQRLVVGALLIVASSLFKSYGLIFAIPVMVIAWPRFTTTRARCRAIVAAVLVALPVVAWHTYAQFQGGYNEVSSHDITTKLHTLINPKLYKSLWRDYTHFVGLIPGVAAIGIGVWSYARGRKRNDIPCWILPWALALPPYALATLDKLIDHEYYVLPFAVPLVALVGIVLGSAIAQASEGSQRRGVWCGGLTLALVTTQLTMTYRSVSKAQRENPDVVMCADIVQRATQPGDLVAFLSDTQRYNSIAYYAERRGIHVEGFAFPAERYRREGAHAFVFALDPDGQDQARRWIKQSFGGRYSSVAGGIVGADFRGKTRMCEVLSDTQR